MKNLQELYELQRRYIELLKQESDELIYATMAYNWKSSRHNEGCELAAHIKKLEADAARPTKDCGFGPCHDCSYFGAMCPYKVSNKEETANG